MRQLCFLILLCLNIASAQEFLTLERCLQLAESNNLELKAAREVAIQSVADFDEANAVKFPTFDISGQLTGQEEQVIDTSGLLQATGAPPGTFPPQFVISEAIQRQAAATFQVLLTTFGQVEHQIVAAFLKAEADELNLQTGSRQVAYQVKEGFFNLLSAMEATETARLNLTTAQEHYKETEILLKSGLVAKFELIKAEQDVVQAQESVVKGLLSEELGLAALRFLLNADGPLPAKLETPRALVVGEVELEHLKSAAVDHRPEMQVMSKNLEASYHLLKSAKASNRPTLSFSLVHSRQSGSALAPASNFQAVLAFQIPLYDGGTRKAKVTKAKSTLRQLEHQSELLKNQILLEVEQAWVELQMSLEAHKTAQALLKTAEETHRMAAVRFQNGISTSLEYEDTQRTLAGSRRQVVQTKLQQDLAFASLEKALGFDIPQRQITPETLGLDEKEES